MMKLAPIFWIPLNAIWTFGECLVKELTNYYNVKLRVAIFFQSTATRILPEQKLKEYLALEAVEVNCCCEERSSL